MIMPGTDMSDDICPYSDSSNCAKIALHVEILTNLCYSHLCTLRLLVVMLPHFLKVTSIFKFKQAESSLLGLLDCLR
jgi:hypothetical protein